MIQYLVILLDDTSVSFCHYRNNKQEPNLMSLDTLKAAIVYAMKENLNIQFVYPDYPLPHTYEEVIESTDHIKIKPVNVSDDADIIVFNSIAETKCFAKPTLDDVSYVVRTDRGKLFAQVSDIVSLLNKVKRLNVIITDVDAFTDDDFNKYSGVLQELSEIIENLYLNDSVVQLNLLTDRMMLDKMNNCGAGDMVITLAPNGKFYVCPAFYYDQEDLSVGNLSSGLDIKNPQLYKLDHAPLCRNCDAYQCNRCIWLNHKTTFEVNTPSHEQCVLAHLERNCSRMLLKNIRRHGQFLTGREDIKEISYLDPFDVRKEW